MKDRVIRGRVRPTNKRKDNGGAWLYVMDSTLVREESRATRMTSDEAGRRLLSYLNDYPTWEFEEVAAPGPQGGE